MKKCKIWSVMLFSLFTIHFTVSAQQDEASQKVYDILKSKRYEIKIDRMNPMKGSSRSLTSDYSIKQMGDSIASYLPYQGRAYSAPYGGGSGLIFETAITDYSITKGKKKTTISFDARTSEDTYSYTIQVYDSGASSVYVNANKRQSISFYGDLVFNEK